MQLQHQILLNQYFLALNTTNLVEVEKRLKNINTKKATGLDKIQPKLVKLSAEIKNNKK